MTWNDKSERKPGQTVGTCCISLPNRGKGKQGSREEREKRKGQTEPIGIGSHALTDLY